MKGAILWAFFELFGDFKESKNATPFEIMRQAVFLYWAQNNKALSRKEGYYPQYFFYDYNVADCRAYHKFLIKHGYLAKSSLDTILESVSITKLKGALKAMNLPQNGKKPDLIVRLIKNLSEGQSSQIVKENEGYELTALGREYLQRNEEYINLHKCTFEITLDEYESMKQKLFAGGGKRWSYPDIVWAILNERQLKYSKRKKDRGLLRNTFHHKYEHLRKDDPVRAYQMLLVLFLMDCDEDFAPPGIIKALKRDSKHFHESMIDECYKYFRGKTKPKDFLASYQFVINSK